MSSELGEIRVRETTGTSSFWSIALLEGLEPYPRGLPRVGDVVDNPKGLA